MLAYSSLGVLRKRKSYARLFAATIVNGVGDRFSQVAVLSLVLTLTGSGLAVGISMGIRIIPFLVLAPIGGMLVNKLPRKAILITTDLLRFPVALSFLLVRSADDVWIIYAANFVLAAGEAIYAPVRKSSIPLLVHREELLTVNGLEQALMGSVLVIGSVSGGVLSVLLGSEWSFTINALSFLITAMLISRIDFGRRPTVQSDSSEIAEAMPSPAGRKFGSFRTLRPLTSSLPLKIVLGFELLVTWFNGIENVLISVYAIQVFHAGDLGVGLIYGSIGAGLMLSLLAGCWGGKRLIAGALVALMIEGVLMIFISFAPKLWMVCLTYIVLTCAGGLGNAFLDTVLMKEVPENQQGPVFGLLAAVSNTLISVSMLLAGMMLEVLDPRTAGRLAGLGYLAITVFLACLFWIGRLYASKRESLSRSA